jgi:hypothetical protein
MSDKPMCVEICEKRYLEKTIKELVGCLKVVHASADEFYNPIFVQRLADVLAKANPPGKE